jgi:hypothetical protein
MARDAGGKPATVAPATNRSDSAKSNSSAASTASASSKKGNKSKEEPKANLASGKVTRTIKGGKEAVIQIPALHEKGYLASVDLDAGLAPKKAAPRSRQRK